MSLIIQKFGGTSVADLSKIKNVANLIKSEIDSGNQVIAVVSAMAGVTNSLITKASKLSKLDQQSHMREYDAAIASGEVVTAALLSLQLQNMGLNAKSLQGWQIPFKTDKIHGNAQVKEINTDLLINMLDDGIIPIVTGFQGLTENGDVTTLGKGGSDTSAAILAAALNAYRCDIYTDVNGIYTADPRVVDSAKKIDTITLDELFELCSSGAKVLHPRAALAAKRYGFTLRVLSSFTNSTGTIVDTIGLNMENRTITAITSNKNLLKIDIEYKANDFSKIIESFSKESIQLEQTSNLGSQNSTIITNLSDKNKCQKLLNTLKNNSSIVKYELNANISSVTILGYGIKNDSTLAWKIINILINNGIQILSSYLSDIKVSILINDQDNEKVIKLLHNYCF